MFNFFLFFLAKTGVQYPPLHSFPERLSAETCFGVHWQAGMGEKWRVPSSVSHQSWFVFWKVSFGAYFDYRFSNFESPLPLSKPESFNNRKHRKVLVIWLIHMLICSHFTPKPVGSSQRMISTISVYWLHTFMFWQQTLLLIARIIVGKGNWILLWSVAVKFLSLIR